ncbi:Homoserine O-succinyltransferase [Hyphodiscus hymeniophilus]|uniref:Homoserine O-succinyltransferase n=1 Tax=Hyphodiscus hymeniophilus TaxID=353542 RepID=A0A9P6SM68_9HELO|nr:Homoserine O-succinyltransferase [Hyphodiscus hymeniophilus]
MLGNGQSTSPSNDAQFPSDYSLRYEDNIHAQYALTQHLGIKSLEAVIGFSMGAQQAYYWAVMHGSGAEPFVKSAVAICGSAKTSGHNYAFLEGPITALETSIDYDGGKYKEKGVVPTKGLRAFGRAYAAWLTSSEWFRQDLYKQWLGVGSLKEWMYPPEGKGSFESWDAEDLLTLAREWQAGDVGAVGGDGDYRKALEGITARVLVMPCETDQYFDVKDGENEVKYLKKGTFMPIPSIWGHIAGGGANEADVAWMDGKIGEFLSAA